MHAIKYGNYNKKYNFPSQIISIINSENNFSGFVIYCDASQIEIKLNNKILGGAYFPLVYIETPVAQLVKR